MSRYSQKRLRRIAPDTAEPQDAYSAIPDPALRLYFRARAGLYGMTGRSYRSLKIELPPSAFCRLANGGAIRFSLPITDGTAVCLGELFRDRRKGLRVNLGVFSVPFGGRMRVKVMSCAESHSCAVGQERIWLFAWGFAADGRPLRRDWLASGLVVAARA